MLRALPLWTGVLALLFVSADQPPRDQIRTDQAALAACQELVGAWKGAGQPQRGSNKGAWTEAADWKWQFDQGRAWLQVDLADGKYWRSARLAVGEKPGQFDFTAQAADGQTEERFTGSRNDEGKLIVSRENAPAGRPARVTIAVVAEGARLTLLLEQTATDGKFARLAELGYTRVGSDFGQGGSGPECVVTGGKGTIAVEYQGQTYYVCCTGCRDAFKENPGKILAEFAARKRTEAAGKK